MKSISHTLFRFLLVLPIVFLVYGAGVAAYSFVDTTFAPSGVSSRALIITVGSICAFGSVLAGAAVAPRSRVLVAGLVVVLTTLSQVLQLPPPSSAARTRVFWAAGIHAAFACGASLLVVFYERKRMSAPSRGELPGA